MSEAATKLISLTELATAGLPSLPTTGRGLRKRAAAEGWAMTTGARGTYLVDIATLPDDLRAALEAHLQARFKSHALPVPANAERRGAGRPKGTDYFSHNPAVADAVEAILARHKFAAPRILEMLAAQEVEPLPHIRTLRRFITQLEASKPALLASMRDPDLFKSKYRVALGSADGDATYAHQWWELDTTKADVMTKGGRCMVFGLIDRYSRRAFFMTGGAESGQMVRRLITEAIKAWGVVPDGVITDNGSGYINQSVKSALELLGIQHRICPPGSPEKKPFVERLFGIFMRERAVLIDGFTGHNVAQGQKIRARAKKETGRAEILASIDADELQVILAAWLDGVYHTRVHGKLGMSPMTRWQMSPKAVRAAPDDMTLLRALSAYVGTGTVGKRGVQWKRGRYWSGDLVQYMGRTVHIRRDEDDLGALFIFDEDGDYICTAVNHMRAGFSEEEFAKAAKAQQTVILNKQRAELREKQRAFNVDAARAAVLRADAEAAGKLVVLPVPTRSAPVMAEALPATQLPRPVTMPQRASMDSAAMAERAARAETLIADDAAGFEVDPAQLAWAKAFIRSAAFAAFNSSRDHFGGQPTAASINHKKPRTF